MRNLHLHISEFYCLEVFVFVPVNSAAQSSPACPAVIKMTQFIMCNELLKTQWEAISYLDLLEKMISHTSEHAQNLIDQCFSDLYKSSQEQVEEQ